VNRGRPAAVALVLLALAGCRAPAPSFTTWASLGERPVEAAPVEVEAMPPAGAVPWAGTVSHHLLTDALLDRWFAELARHRSVSVFYVLSPSHWGLSTLPFSLTDGTWHVPGGDVESDRPRAEALARTLGVAFEPSVFEGEHGISTLMPYLSRHFPRARVVAMAYRGEPPLDQPMALKLAQALEPAFARKERSGNFLLISTDFAHHGDEAGTAIKDERSRRFFAAPSLDTWIFAGCDNRPGIYALARLARPATRCSILYHADSLELSGRDPTDITSYFFTYFWEEES
jgi:AmmeMemoRadiSam system protein B